MLELRSADEGSTGGGSNRECWLVNDPIQTMGECAQQGKVG